MRMLHELTYIECMICHNYFFVREIGEDGLNDPTYCAYCGTKFEGEIDDF